MNTQKATTWPFTVLMFIYPLTLFPMGHGLLRLKVKMENHASNKQPLEGNRIKALPRKPEPS